MRSYFGFVRKCRATPHRALPVLLTLTMLLHSSAQAQFGLPQLPGLPQINIPGVLGVPGLPQQGMQPNQIATQAISAAVGHALGYDLPIRLDAKTAFQSVAPPADFRPTPIECTPANLNMQLRPGDYTCKVRLYCMRDSVHRPSYGIAYKLAPLQGKQAPAIGSLIARGTIANIPPETLQTISWEIQASIPLGQMPPQHQQVVSQLIPEYEQGLRGDFLQQIEDTYNRFRAVGNLPPLDTILNQMGGAGRVIQDIRRSREIIRENALDFGRLNEAVYDKSQGGPQTLVPPEPQTSPWSEIRPGILAQLTIEDGNLGLNKLNFRVLPRARRFGNRDTGNTIKNVSFVKGGSEQLAQVLLVPAEVTTLEAIFGISMAGGRAGVIAQDAAIIAFATKFAAQALQMAMNNTNPNRRYGGSIQIQGPDNNGKEIYLSWSWSPPNSPPTAVQAIAELQTLVAQISPKAFRARNIAIQKAMNYINNCASYGGCSGPKNQSFFNPGMTTERVDVNIFSGTAFIP